jgi:hypothetical protein
MLLVVYTDSAGLTLAAVAAAGVASSPAVAAKATTTNLIFLIPCRSFLRGTSPGTWAARHDPQPHWQVHMF